MTEYSPEFIASVEKLNLFYHIHLTNADMMKNIGILVDKITSPDIEAVSAEFLEQWLAELADRTQTIDALMHICQDNFTGEAQEWLDNADTEEQIRVRDEINTPILTKLESILTETGEERTQRILLEHLGIHD